jgi:hypothetical protein
MKIIIQLPIFTQNVNIKFITKQKLSHYFKKLIKLHLQVKIYEKRQI